MATRPLLALLVFTPLISIQCAFALDHDRRRIEDMLKEPAHIARFEERAQARPDDPPETKKLRQDLKASIANYRKAVKDIKKQYDDWIKSGYRADQIQEEIQKTQNDEYGKLLLKYIELGAVELKGYCLAPHGSKGEVAESINVYKVGGLEMVMDIQANELDLSERMSERKRDRANSAK